MIEERDVTYVPSPANILNWCFKTATETPPAMLVESLDL